jgi:hypothetical protein
MTISSQQFGFAPPVSEKRAKSLIRDLTTLFCQTLFGGGQTLARDFQIVVAVAKFNEQFGQSDQVFNLIAQWPPAPTAHFFQFRPLFVGHADVKSEIFLCHSFKAAKAKL